MEYLEYIPSADDLAFTFGGAEPRKTVQPGTVMRLFSEDAYNGRLSATDQLAHDHVNWGKVNPQTGPFYVEGAEPGDTLVLHIVDLWPGRDYGVSTSQRFFGNMSSTDRNPSLQEPLEERTWIYKVDHEKQTIRYKSSSSGLEMDLPLACMLGTVGLAPAAGEVRSSTVPERFGGNMDTPEMKAGTTVYLRVNVDGALFSIGDGHLRQGEGEPFGNAVEGAMNSVLMVDLIKGSAPTWPRLENDDYLITTGSSRPLEDAWKIALREMIDWIVEVSPLDAIDAYQLVSQTAKAPIANVVDPNYTCVLKVEKRFIPGFEGAYGKIHERLRNDEGKAKRLADR